jgi:hypothetical protein
MKKLFLITSLMFGLLVTIGNASAEPTITGATATGTTIKFTTTLSEKLFSGYKVKIDLNNGKGFVAMKCSALTCTLSSNALPKGVDDASYSVGIYDSKGFLQGDTIDGSYVITSSAEVNTVPTIPPVITVPTIPPVTTVPSSATSYSKISNSGSTLPDSAKLGANPTDWACTRDNETGLIWEVKTDDGRLRDKDWNYSWNEPDASKMGSQNYGSCTGSECDTYAFTKAVNTQGLCGAKDWRMPRKDELFGIIKSGSVPTINTTYFPDIKDTYLFWSSSPSAYGSGNAWVVNFGYGYSGYGTKSSSLNVRLVRG